MRCDCAAMAEPATLKMFMEALGKGMVDLLLLLDRRSSDLILALSTVRFAS